MGRIEKREHSAQRERSVRSARSKARLRRTLTALFVIALMCFSLAFHSGVGSPSSFGVGSFSLLCPLGGIEALVAAKTPIPHALVSLAVVVLVCLVVGRAWCAWGCPATIVRRVFGREEPRAAHALCKKSLWETFRGDSRLWVLAGVLIAALLVGFPVFCLVCPVGLTFGTIMSIWRLVQFNEVNWGLLVFPGALVLEIVAYRKWCVSVCPIAGLLSLIGRFARPLRPRIDATTCLETAGHACGECAKSCPAAIDLHAQDAAYQLADCMRCGECQAACPTESISYVRRKDGDGSKKGGGGA